MLRARGNGYRCIALGLALMSVLACNSDTDETVPGGQPCGQRDQCEDGWVCYQEICRQLCNDHRDCEKTEACEPGVCVPVANYECDEDADCNEPSGCESILDAECYAGQCHYSSLAEGLPCDDDNKCTRNDLCDAKGNCSGEAEAGLPCDDDNKCTRNDLCDAKGNCSGEAIKCETPPANFCSQDDTVFTRYESTGTCNPATGSCEYDYEDIACTDCERSCLDLPVAPRNLVATAGDAQVTLTWEAIDGARSYNVYVSQTAGETANAVPVSAVSSPYVHTSLENGSTYYFAVSAVIEAGEGYLSAEVSAMPRISAPEQVSARGGIAEVTLTWDSVLGADTYNVYWSQQPGVTLGSNRVSDVTSPFVHAPLTNSTTYFYALTAVDGPSESVLCDEVSATTLVKEKPCEEDTCNGHGSCDDTTGVPVCSCDTGYTGNNCDICDEGYQDYGDGACRPNDPCTPNNPCTEDYRTRCSNNSGFPECDCDEGYQENGDGECVRAECDTITFSNIDYELDESGTPLDVPPYWVDGIAIIPAPNFPQVYFGGYPGYGFVTPIVRVWTYGEGVKLRFATPITMLSFEFSERAVASPATTCLVLGEEIHDTFQGQSGKPTTFETSFNPPVSEVALVYYSGSGGLLGIDNLYYSSCTDSEACVDGICQ